MRPLGRSALRAYHASPCAQLAPALPLPCCDQVRGSWMLPIPNFSKSKCTLPTFPNIPFVHDRFIDRFEIREALCKSPTDGIFRNAVPASRNALANARHRVFNVSEHQ